MARSQASSPAADPLMADDIDRKSGGRTPWNNDKPVGRNDTVNVSPILVFEHDVLLCRDTLLQLAGSFLACHSPSRLDRFT